MSSKKLVNKINPEKSVYICQLVVKVTLYYRIIINTVKYSIPHFWYKTKADNQDAHFGLTCTTPTLVAINIYITQYAGILFVHSSPDQPKKCGPRIKWSSGF